MPVVTIGVWNIEDYAVIRERLLEAADLALDAGKTNGHRVFQKDVPIPGQVTVLRHWNTPQAADEFISLCNSLDCKPISYTIQPSL